MFDMEQTGSPSDFEKVTSSSKWVGEPNEALKGVRADSSNRGSTRGPRILKSVSMQVFSLDILVWPRKLEWELQLDGGACHWQTQSPGVYIRRETNIALD